MSYDIYLRPSRATCPACGHAADEPDLPNPTYNLTPIFDLALTAESLPNPDVSECAVVLLGMATERPRGLRLLSGRNGRDTVDLLRDAVARLCAQEHDATFRALEPSNRWGTIEDARHVMADLLAAAEQYPEHVWEVH